MPRGALTRRRGGRGALALVSLTVAVAGGKLARTVTPGTSRTDQLFDVVSELRFEPATTGFQQGIGGDAERTIAN